MTITKMVKEISWISDRYLSVALSKSQSSDFPTEKSFQVKQNDRRNRMYALSAFRRPQDEIENERRRSTDISKELDNI